jgi:hypothetical protein
MQASESAPTATDKIIRSCDNRNEKIKTKQPGTCSIVQGPATVPGIVQETAAVPDNVQEPAAVHGD